MSRSFPKEVLREALVPYYTETYNGLISIVQGVALGVLLVENRELLYGGPYWGPWGRSLTVALTIGLVWHRYVTHNQFLVWRPKFWDSVLPMLLAVTQMALALSIKPAPGQFSFWIFWTSFLSVAAYQNTIWRHRDSGLADEIRAATKADAELLLKTIQDFQVQARAEVITLTGLFGVCWGLVNLGVVGTRGEALIVFVLVVAACIRFFYKDLPQRLESFGTEG